MVPKYPEQGILVFAKAPLPGQVKTRLIPVLGEEGAALLHKNLLIHTLDKLEQVRMAPVELHCAPDTTDELFQQCQQNYGLSLHEQRGNSLGERMQYACEEALKRYRSVLVIGVDCPGLTPVDLHFAFDALNKGYDAVLSPAEDGGYVLLGMNRVSSRLFENMLWGTSSVLKETRIRLREMGWQWYELARRYDIDRPEDLKRLPEELRI